METNKNEKEIRGYKVYDEKWEYRPERCKDEEVSMEIYLRAVDCFRYCDMEPNMHFVEVIVHGKIVHDEDAWDVCYTDDFEIVREVSYTELLRLTNVGKHCIGFANTGDSNAGNCNAGDHNKGYFNTGNDNDGSRNTGDDNAGNDNSGDNNSGDRNSGKKNTGDGNTGDHNSGNKNVGNDNGGQKNTGNNNIGNRNTGNDNSGDDNTGNDNSGDKNTGNGNIGHHNTGDYNKSSHNIGCFMTEEQKIPLFNKPSDWTYDDWLNSAACGLLRQMPQNTTKWVPSDNMTNLEKALYPTHVTTGGCLKAVNEVGCVQLWWDSLSDYQKDIIKSIPNFDPDIFYECTGIEVR